MSLDQVFERALQRSHNRAFRAVGKDIVQLGTDVGLRRSENQDRVAAVRWVRQAYGAEHRCIAVALSDGMGGMLGGAECAAKTVASFFANLIQTDEPLLPLAVQKAVHHANDYVFSEFSGRGGATLTAVVMSDLADPIGVNVGDSRVYVSSRSGKTDGLTRLTIDDTLREAFGGESGDLLQYVGLGSGIKPHPIVFNIGDGKAILTSDGAHFVEPEIFEKIAQRSPDNKSIVERLIALSRWLGGPDNSSVAVLDLEQAHQLLIDVDLNRIDYWALGEDPIQVFIETATRRNTRQRGDISSLETPDASSAAQPEFRQKQSKRQKKPSKNANEIKQDQLQIDVSVSGPDEDADRK